MSSTAISKTPSANQTPLYGSVYIPDFEVQAFVRYEPSLRRQPVAVLDGTFPLFTVAGTNALARRMGVQAGMTRFQLEQFDDLQIRHRSREQENSTHHALLDCAHYFTPRIEDTSVDTITLDLSGLSGLWGTPRAIAQKLLRATDKLGLEVHVATAPNPDTAIHAVKAEAGITIIGPGEEARKLGALPLAILNPPDTMSATFDRWGIHTFRELAALPAIQVSERLGPEGVRLQRLTRGAVQRPLEPATEPLHFSESMELEGSVESLEPLTFILSRLLNQLCQRLMARNLTTNEVRLTLGLDTGPRTVPGASSQTFERRIQTPVPIRESKTLLKLLQLDLDTHRPPAPVTHVTLAAEPVAPRKLQDHLFRPRTPEPEKLELTLARIGSIVGQENIGTPTLIDSHRPDAFRIQRFRVLQSTSETSVTPQPRRKNMSSLTPAALRISRPSQPITVEMQHGQPARMLFAGKTGKVVTCAGPWNASGDWWRNDTWNREEWDVEVQTDWRHTLYRIYRDPRKDCWFIDGVYD